jgi:hypothetical protein
MVALTLFKTSRWSLPKEKEWDTLERRITCLEWGILKTQGGQFGYPASNYYKKLSFVEVNGKKLIAGLSRNGCGY